MAGVPVQKKDQGFTLLELMFVLAIISVLAIVGVPQYHAVKENYRLEGAAQKAVSQLNYGKQMSMDSRATVYVVFARHEVGVYTLNPETETLTLTGSSLPYEGGVTFTATDHDWMAEVHEDPTDPNSLLLGKGVRYNFRGYALENGTIRLVSRSGSKVCILIGEGTGRIVIDQCEEIIADDDDDDDDDDEEESYCEGEDPIPDYPAWQARNYPTAGTYVTYNGRAFYNRYYAHDYEIPGAGIGPWQEVTRQWRYFNVYVEGDLVCYNGRQFKARYWAQNQNMQPGLVSSPWQEITDEWRDFNVYEIGDIVKYEGKQFQAREWTQNELPGVVNHPWQELTDEWRAYNVYHAGDRVFHLGREFIATQYSLNKEPGIPGNPWQELTEEWSSTNAYHEGDLVMYQGSMWRATSYSINKQPGIIGHPWFELTDEWRPYNAYQGGEIVWYNGKQYKARYYSLNVEPKDNDPYGAWVEV
ncbi:MAG: carbohydrate-binding protein [Desulfitobacteriia bacterium]|jgi:prepilin-type N-terminal cleavage/methylation domain-containing protein